MNTSRLTSFSSLSSCSYEGRGTIYQQFGVAGSCGNVHQDSDMIVALGHNFMQHQYQSAWCGHRMKVTNFGSQDVNVGGKGNSVIVTVGDSCDGCGPYDVDFSVGAWNKLTNSAPWSTFDAVWYVLR